MLQPGLPAAAASEGGGGTGADPALSKKAARRAEKAAAAKKRGASGPALEGGGRQQRKAKQQVARLEGGVVCVAGGGIGGLGAALALQKRGIAVKVYERDVSLLSRPQGYGMTLSTTNTALEELGLLEELRERDTTSSSHYVFAANGEILGYFGGAFQPSRPQTGERGNLRVPRQILRQMLLSRLKPGTVRWGTEVMHFEEIEAKKADSATKRQTGAGAAVSAPPPASAAPPAAAAAAAPTASAGKVDVTLSDGAVEQFDVLIGAEGIRSRIRSMKVKDTLKYLVPSFAAFAHESSPPSSPSRRLSVSPSLLLSYSLSLPTPSATPKHLKHVLFVDFFFGVFFFLFAVGGFLKRRLLLLLMRTHAG